MHLTLRFPAEIHSDRLRELALALRRALSFNGRQLHQLPWHLKASTFSGYANIDENVLSKAIEEFARQLHVS